MSSIAANTLIILFGLMRQEMNAYCEHMRQDNIELTMAVENLAGVFERNPVSSIIRGAVFSSSLAVDAHFPAAVSTQSPLFKLPVDAVQRGRDHGELEGKAMGQV